MKKIFAIAITLMLVCALFIVPASAADIDIHHEKCAEALRELNLFRGTDKGFELERPMTRAEAAAMLVRFLGAEEEALSGSFSHPFTDVPKWADGYVGWLYEGEITNGVSKTLFGSDEPITAHRFATLITRATQKYESIPYELITPAEINKIDNGIGFTRGDASIMSVRALSLTQQKKFGSPSVAEILVDSEIFSAEELDSALGGVVEYNYYAVGEICRKLCNVTVAKSQLGGFRFEYESTPICGKNNVIAYRKTTNGYIMYSVDKQTLNATRLGKRKLLDKFYYEVLCDIGETTIVKETTYNDNKHKFSVIAIKGGQMRELLSYGYNNHSSNDSKYIGNDSFADSEFALFVNDNKYFFVTEESVFEHNHNFTDIMSFQKGRIFAIEIKDKSTELLMADAKTGEIITQYSVDDDRPDTPAINRDLDESGVAEAVYFSGEAGLYHFDGNTLTQITDMPVNDFTMNDEEIYVITHNPGVRLGGRFDKECGNILKKLNADGTVDESFSPIKNIGYSIVGVYHQDNTLHFGVSADINFIARLEEDGQITVIDIYSPSIAKIEDILAAKNKTREEAIWDIQKHIDELGY